MSASELQGAVTVGVEDRPGEVILHFSRQTKDLVMKPENAFPIAEGIARAAHRAKFGDTPNNDHSYLAQQVRARVTEQLRDRMVVRAGVMLTSMIEKQKDVSYMAQQITDSILAEVDR